MKFYRVEFERVMRQKGFIVVPADSRRDAVALGLELAESPSELVRKPEWTDQLTADPIIATDANEVAA
jgi:hypothetical protein